MFFCFNDDDSIMTVSISIECHYAQCCIVVTYAECQFGEHHYAKCHFTEHFMLTVGMLNAAFF